MGGGMVRGAVGAPTPINTGGARLRPPPTHPHTENNPSYYNTTSTALAAVKDGARFDVANFFIFFYRGGGWSGRGASLRTEGWGGGAWEKHTTNMATAERVAREGVINKLWRCARVVSRRGGWGVGGVRVRSRVDTYVGCCGRRRSVSTVRKTRAVAASAASD